MKVFLKIEIAICAETYIEQRGSLLPKRRHLDDFRNFASLLTAALPIEPACRRICKAAVNRWRSKIRKSLSLRLEGDFLSVSNTFMQIVII